MAGSRALVVLLSVLLLTLSTMPPLAYAANGAEFTGGGVVQDDVRYARAGDLLTLAVTSSDDKCLVVIDDERELYRQPLSGNQSSTTWTATVPAASGDGQWDVHATTYSNPSCNPNQATGTATASYVRDNTAPGLSGAATDDNLGADGWYVDDVTVEWTCTDNGAGVEVCPGPTVLTGEGEAVTASESVADRVGNATTGNVSVKIDRTAPTTMASPVDRWSRTSVTLELTATDGLSGVADTLVSVNGGPTEVYDGSMPFDEEGDYTVEYWSVDRAGNEEARKQVTFGIDQSSPTISSSQEPLANSAGWNRTDVTVSFECDDALSGIASCSDPVTVTGQVQGHAVEGTATDNAGNQAGATHVVNIDRTAPVVTSKLSGTEGEDDWYTGPVTVTFRCDDPESDGVSSGIPSGTCPPAQVLSVDGADQSSEPVTVHDAAGNESTSHQADGIDIDQAAPTTTISGVPSGWANETVTVELLAADATSGVATTHYALDGVSHEYGAPFDITDEGVHTLHYWSVDAAGNQEVVQSGTIQIDRTAPVTQAHGVPDPDGWTNDPVAVTLTATDTPAPGSEVAETYYRVNGGASETYVAEIALSEHGTHEVAYWSVDGAGNVEEEQTATVRIDTVAPTLSGEALATNLGDGGWYTDDITVRWQCSDADSGLAGDCPEEDVLTTEGDALSVTRTIADNAGNTTSSTVDGLKLDRTAPETTYDGPSGWHAEHVTVTLSATDNLSGVASTRYTVNGGEPQTYTDPIQFGEGEYDLTFWSVDEAGNPESPAAVTVQVDLTDPEITSSQDPRPNEAGWNNDDVTVSFVCEDALSGIATCSSDVLLDSEGEHEVLGEAQDNAGNTSTTSRTVRIDRTAPTIESDPVGAAGEAGWFTGPVTVTFTCDDPVSGGVASGIPAGTCPDAQELAHDGADQSTTPVTVDDQAGNTSLDHQVVDVDIDQTDPETAITGAPDGWTNGPVTVGITASDATSGVASTHYQVDGGAVQHLGPEGGPVTVSGEGIHTLQYWSVDVAGNTESTGTATIRIDLTVPTTAVQGVPSGWVNHPVEITLAPSDSGGSGVAETFYRVGSGEVQAYDGPFTISDEGEHTVTWWSVDAAGNRESERTATVRIDRTAPQSSDDAPTGWQGESVVVSLTAVDTGGSGLSATTYRIDGGAEHTYDGPITFDAPGVYTLAYWSTDGAGNVEGERAATVRVDLDAPIVTVDQPLDGSSTTAESITVSGLATDEHSGIATIAVNDVEATVGGGNYAVNDVALDCGPNVIVIEATDNVGHSTTRSVDVTRQCASVTSVARPLVASQPGNVVRNVVRGNRVVPVKVDVEYQDVPYLGDAPLGNPTIAVRRQVQCANPELDGQDVADTVGNANTGNAFRWSGSEWVYNLSVAGLDSGSCYRVDVSVDGARASSDMWVVLEVR